MEYYGYAGKILYVNLSSGEVRKEPLDLEMAQKFIGGWGINYHLLYKELKPNVHPLSPENPIIIGIGPLMGTPVPAASKVVATMKFPAPASKTQERYVVATAVGGNRRFGPMLKNAGYDHVVITGRAKKPSYLKIIDDDVEICDASDLWGKKNIYEITDILSYRHKGRTTIAGVWAIGKAGQNQLMGATGFLDKASGLGRWGGGAALGSKNLTAVVTHGSKGVKVADPIRFMALVEAKRQEIKNHPAWRTQFPMAVSGAVGATADENYPATARDDTTLFYTGCISCVDPCRIAHKIEGGMFDGDVLQTGHWMTIVDYGRRLRITDYRQAIKLIDLINQAGLDHQGAVRMLYWVTRLYERGVITDKDTGGLVLKRGDFDSYIKLLEKYVNRQDIGDAMAEGWYKLSERVGVDAELDFRDGAVIVRGVDPIPDPRFQKFSPCFGMAMLTRPRAQHLHQDTYFPAGEDVHKDTYWPEYKRTLADLRRDAKRLEASEEEINRIFTKDDFNVGRMEKIAEDGHGIWNALGICDSGAHWDWDAPRNISQLADFYSAATGFQITPKELRRKGEMVWTMERLLNVREGWTRQIEEIPEAWIHQMETPIHLRTGDRYFTDWLNRRVFKEDIERWLDDYYDEREWDIKLGIPTVDKLRSLGLDEFIEVVEPFFKR